MLKFPTTLDGVPTDYEVFRKDDPQSLTARVAFFWMRFGLNIRQRKQVFLFTLFASSIVGVTIGAPSISAWWSLVGFGLAVGYIVAMLAGAQEAAETGWYKMHQAIGGHVYISQDVVDENDGEAVISESGRWHEGVHLWQRKVYGVLGHQARFILDPRGVALPILRDMIPKYRLHAEAQAYAIQVARGDRTLGDALDKLMRPVYAMGTNREYARKAIQEYTLTWKEMIDRV